MAELFLGHSIADRSKVYINREDLTTHSVVVGRTGSGKTGLIHVLVEEAVMQGASTVVLDPKGDLTNLLLSFPGLTPQEFAPWVPAGKNATDEAHRWSDGLKATDQDVERVMQWRNAASFRVFTPGYVRSGQSVNLLPDLEPPVNAIAARERATQIVSTILSALGIDADPLTDTRSVFLAELLLWAWKKGKSLPLEKWPAHIVDVPKELSTFDNIDINDLFPRKDRLRLASSIVGFRRQASRWLSGPSLNPDNFLLPGNDGRPQVTIFTLRHLNADDRQLFVSMFLSSLVDWIYKAPASGRLRALVVLDEAAGYLPPHPYNPPTKRPICTLLSQGRAAGLGVLIGTQNPNDLDYKALSNVGTWFLGGLRDRDTKRDLDAILKERGIDTSKLYDVPERTFMALTRDGKAHSLKARWTLSYLRGPIDTSELERLTQPVSTLSEKPKTITNKVEISEKTRQVLSGFIQLNFDLLDTLSRKFDVDVTYSTDGGKTWAIATPYNSATMRQLASSPSGVKHCFGWNSPADIGFKFIPNVLTCIHAKGANGLMLPAFDVANNTLCKEIDESL